MKKKEKKWFTLTELLVVISIMTIIWIWAFSSFWNFLEKYSLKNDISLVKQKIDFLDTKIKNNDLFDYRVVFKRWRNWFYYYENYNFWDKKQDLKNIDFKNWTWSFYIPSWTSTWILFYNIYLDNKLVEKDILKAKKIKEFNFKKHQKVFIKSFLNWERLDNINIIYFWEKKSIKKSNIILKDIKCSSSSINNNKLIIENIWWNKKFFYNSNNCSNPELIFEDNGEKINLKLKK